MPTYEKPLWLGLKNYPITMVLELAQLYRYVEIEHSELFDPDVVTPYGSEPKWRKDVLWALQDAKRTRNPQTDRQWQVAENLSSHFGLPTLFPPFWKVYALKAIAVVFHF